MAAPRGKVTRFDGGRRPWNVPQEQSYVPVEESIWDAAERKACLSCSLPECLEGSVACALRAVRKSRRAEADIATARPMPEGFSAVAAGLRRKDLAKRYGVSTKLIDRWRQEAGLIRGKMQPPESFRYYGRVESLEKLSKRFGVSRSVVSRWRRELGISPETKK